MELNASHKEEVSAYLPFGVTKVQIVGFSEGKTDSGKEYVEVAFVTAEGIEDRARVWFSTDAAARYSFNTLRTIFLHSCPEDEKEKATKAIDAVPTTEKLVELIAPRLAGKEMWVTKYVDPTRTYEKNGQTFKSVNVNVYGHEPKLNEELMPKPQARQSVAQAVGGVFDAAAGEDVPFKNGGSQASDWV